MNINLKLLDALNKNFYYEGMGIENRENMSMDLDDYQDKQMEIMADWLFKKFREDNPIGE